MSEPSIYVVRPKDSLSKIAAAHGTTANAIAELNHLSNLNRIAVGQKLRLPAVSVAKAPSLPRPAPESPSLYLQFVDALNVPIQALKVRIEHLGEQIEYLTDGGGKVPAVELKQADAKAKISVERFEGGWKEVAHITASSDATAVRLRSPKVALDSSMRPHEGGAQPAAVKKLPPAEPGEVTETRSPAGNPVQQVALECPNPNNLRLGPNFKYRDIILAAAERSKMSPQSIAAIMNAEAAKITITHKDPIMDKKTGKQAVGKDGKPRFKTWIENTGEWNARSASPLSSARGMTQFLDTSWVDLAFSEGTYLNQHAKKEGWITTTVTSNVVKTKKGKTVVATTVQKTVPAFKLANNTFVTKAPLAKTLSQKPYITGRATANDGNLQKLLDLRFEAEYAIHTAVDYGVENLNALTSAGFKVSSLNDGEKAKIVYLAHHLGLADAKAFINNTMGASHAQYLLENQVGEDNASDRADAEDGDYLAAHRKWLKKFIDEQIDLIPKMCDPSKASSVRDLISITEAIRADGSSKSSKL